MEKAIEIDLFEDVLMGAVREVRRTFRVGLPGMVKSFTRDTGRAAITLAVRFLGQDRVPREEPEVTDLPILKIRGGGYGIHFDLREGDPVFAVCGDAPMLGFYETGQMITPQIPVGHQYGTAVGIPGGWISSSIPGQETPPPNDPGWWWMGAEDGTATVMMAGAGIPSPAELGTVVISTAGPMDSIKLGSKDAEFHAAVAEAVSELIDGFLGVFTEQWVPVPQDGGAALQIALQAWKINALSGYPKLKIIADKKVMLEGTGLP